VRKEKMLAWTGARRLNDSGKSNHVVDLSVALK